MSKIQFKRGLEQDIPILSVGEPGYTTDTHKLFVGSTNGNIQIAKIDDLNGLQSAPVIPNSYSWVSTDGQDTFQIPSGKFYDKRLITVTVGGVIQNNITLIDNKTFQLPETLSSGVNIYAEWYEVAIPVTAGHHSTHELNGADEIDVTKLLNYKEQIGTPINVLIGLNDYSNFYTYTASGDIASETIKDSASNVICTTTYNYTNNVLNTVVFTMNGTTVTSTYNYDANGNLVSVTNTKS